MDIKAEFLAEMENHIGELQRVIRQIEANTYNVEHNQNPEGVSLAQWFIHAQIGQLRQILKGMNNRSYYYGRLFVKNCKEKNKQQTKGTAKNET